MWKIWFSFDRKTIEGKIWFSFDRRTIFLNYFSEGLHAPAYSPRWVSADTDKGSKKKWAYTLSRKMKDTMLF